MAEDHAKHKAAVAKYAKESGHNVEYYPQSGVMNFSDVLKREKALELNRDLENDLNKLSEGK